jgi:AcrR family transcriptional regulator
MNGVVSTNERRKSAGTALARRLRPPLQTRSRRSQERVLDACAEMLATQPFDRITMADLARRAGVAVTSIYARFSDKRALVLALHERHVEETARHTATLLDPDRWRGADLETVVRGVIAGVVVHLLPRAHLLRAVLLADDPDVEARAAELMRRGSEAVAELLGPRLGGVAPRERDRLVDFALRAVMALVHQRLIFSRHEPGRFALSERELTRRLGDLFLAIVTNGGRR